MRLKNLILTLFSASGLLLGCSDKVSIAPREELLDGTWNLKKLSGGFAGLDENYPDQAITWTFNAQNQTIIINNNIPTGPDMILKNGTYNYSITTVANQKYLNIDSGEFGGLTISNNSLIVDQNKISNGVGADGFMLNFEK